MIAKAIPIKHADKSHFAHLVEYITDEQDTPFRLGAVTVTNCYSDDDVEMAVLEVLNTQLQNQRAISDKTYHLIASFKAGEEPSADVLKAIEEEICVGLGFKEHQRVSAVHCDTDNLHIHVAINKIHRVTHKIHNPFRDYRTLAKLCTQLEQKYGLEIDNHTTQRNHTASKARDMEAHVSIESLISWIQQNALAQIKQADCWEALHAILHENGLSIKPKGNGLAISIRDGEYGVKASSVAKELSKGKLEQRLGNYQPANTEMLANLHIKQRYERKPINHSPQSNQAVAAKEKEDLANAPVDLTKQPTLPARINSNELFAVYQAQIAERTLDRNHALSMARNQHKLQIAQAKANAFSKRLWIKTLIQPGINKKLLLALVGKALKTNIQQINHEYRHIRQRLFNQHRRLAWLDWLQIEAKQGNSQALQLLRQRHVTQDQRGNILSRSRYTSGVGHNAQNTANAIPPKRYEPDQAIAKVTKQGTVFYLHDKAVIKDDGNRFHVAADASQEAITAALIQAKQRHGYQLSVQGNELFQENVVRASVKAGLNISFEECHLERRRVQLNAEAHLFGKGAVNQLADKQKLSWSR